MTIFHLKSKVYTFVAYFDADGIFDFSSYFFGCNLFRSDEYAGFRSCSQRKKTGTNKKVNTL